MTELIAGPTTAVTGKIIAKEMRSGRSVYGTTSIVKEEYVRITLRVGKRSLLKIATTETPAQRTVALAPGFALTSRTAQERTRIAAAPLARTATPKIVGRTKEALIPAVMATRNAPVRFRNTGTGTVMKMEPLARIR